MIYVKSASDILTIVNNPLLYTHCDQCENTIMIILTFETITNENRIKFFSTIKEYTEKIIRTAIEHTRDEDMYKLYDCIKNITKDIELYVINNVKVITTDLYNVLKYKDSDDIKRKMFMKLEFGKMMLYNSIENKTNDDTIYALKHCNSNDAYELFKTLPQTLEYELALCENMQLKWLNDAYNMFKYKDNEELIITIIDSKILNNNSNQTIKFIKNIVNLKFEMSDNLVNKIVKIIQLHDIYLYSACDKIKHELIKNGVINIVGDMYDTDYWKHKILLQCINNKNLTYFSLISYCESVINNDILSQLLSFVTDSQYIKELYSVVKDVDDKNFNLMLNHCSLYELMDIRPRRISGTLFMKYYNVDIIKFWPYVIFDKTSRRQFLNKNICNYVLIPFLHISSEKSYEEVELLKQD